MAATSTGGPPQTGADSSSESGTAPGSITVNGSGPAEAIAGCDAEFSERASGSFPLCFSRGSMVSVLSEMLKVSGQMQISESSANCVLKQDDSLTESSNFAGSTAVSDHQQLRDQASSSSANFSDRRLAATARFLMRYSAALANPQRSPSVTAAAYNDNHEKESSSADAGCPPRKIYFDAAATEQASDFAKLRTAVVASVEPFANASTTANSPTSPAGQGDCPWDDVRSWSTGTNVPSEVTSPTQSEQQVSDVILLNGVPTAATAVALPRQQQLPTETSCGPASASGSQHQQHGAEPPKLPWGGSARFRNVVLAPEVLLPPPDGGPDHEGKLLASFTTETYDDHRGGPATGTAGGGASHRDSQRGRAEARRYSGDCEEMRSEYDKRVRYNKTLQRRRKSVDSFTLAVTALHVQEMQGLRSFQAPHSASSPMMTSKGLLRSQTTFSVSETTCFPSLGGGTERLYPIDVPTRYGRRNQFGLGKQKSLCILHTSALSDAWPATITSHLTSGQSLHDRLHLFRQLERFLAQPPPKSSPSSSSPSSSSPTSPSPATPPSPEGTPSSTENPNSAQRPAGAENGQYLQSPSRPQKRAHSLQAGKLPGSAYSQVKVPPRRNSGLRLVAGGWSIPRMDKKHRGEDAYFICDKTTGFVGVADGVGEWSDLGCNPREFADQFMGGAALASVRLLAEEKNANGGGHAKDGSPLTPPSKRALRVMREAFDSAVAFGSATGLVAGIDGEGKVLGVANLGDSALIVLRRESRRHRHFTVCRRTKEQQHYFNCPYQLSRVPQSKDLPELEKQGMHRLVKVLSNLQSGFEGDSPDMADCYDIKLQEGDLIIMATDGLLDNLFDREVASLLSLCLSPYEANILAQAGLKEAASKQGAFPHPDSILLPEFDPEVGFATSPTGVARALAEAAFFRGLDPTVKTPFAAQARRAGGYFSGGKMDDITVVAVWVV